MLSLEPEWESKITAVLLKRPYNCCGDMPHKTCELQLLGRQWAHSASGQWPRSPGHRKGKGDRGDQQTPRSCWNATGVTPKPSWFSLRCSEMEFQERTKTELLMRKGWEQADADQGFAEGQWWTQSSVTSGDSCVHSSAPPTWCLRATERSVSFLRDPFSEVTSVGQQSSGSVGLLIVPLQLQLYKWIREHCVANYGTLQ